MAREARYIWDSRRLDAGVGAAQAQHAEVLPRGATQMVEPPRQEYFQIVHGSGQQEEDDRLPRHEAVEASIARAPRTQGSPAGDERCSGEHRTSLGGPLVLAVAPSQPVVAMSFGVSDEPGGRGSAQSYRWNELCADRRYDEKSCRIACARGTGMPLVLPSAFALTVPAVLTRTVRAVLWLRPT
eukprot:4703249-Prymnesium_polylepis.1